MKRFLCFFLCALLLFSGCNLAAPSGNNVTFYYCKADFGYGDAHSVMAPEPRELSQNASDLADTLALYLVGPLDEELSSPFVGLKLLLADLQGEHLQIRLENDRGTIPDSAFSLAAACLTMTCLELTDATQVTIHCANRSLTMSRDNLLLFDSITSTETELEEPQ